MKVRAEGYRRCIPKKAVPSVCHRVAISILRLLHFPPYKTAESEGQPHLILVKSNAALGRPRSAARALQFLFFMTESIHETFMREALKEAQKAFDKGEVPVGAVVVYQNKIIGRAHNQMELLHDPTAHAEMIAVTQAADYLRSQGGGGHRGSLEKASLYVTLEPCPMCAGALVMAHCEHLIYGANDPKAGACGSLYNIVQDDRLSHRLNVIGGVLAEESRLLMQEFFKSLRKEQR